MANTYQNKFDEKYYVPSSQAPDIISNLFNRDKSDLKDRLQWIMNCMTERQTLLSQNLIRIEEDEMNVSNRLSSIGVMWGHDPDEVSTLEKTVFDLQNQKRMERTNAWRDMWTMKRDFIELIKEYQGMTKMDELAK